jgi:hypothetical protein
MAVSGWRLKQANILVSFLLSGGLAVLMIITAAAAELFIELSMRLTLIPQ